MRIALITAIAALFAACGLGTSTLRAQDDPAREYFSAYQEFQRAERLEREGRNADAIAKFRYVATQLSEIKSQFPDWQPLVIDFRLDKTKQAIVRLEGSDSATLGPPPDLPMAADGEDVLPPVSSPGNEPGVAPPTISISPVDGASDSGSAGSDEPPKQASSGGDDDTGRLRAQLDAERSRASELQAQLTKGEAELSSARMELEKTKVLVVDLNTKLRQLGESGGVSSDASAPAREELEKLSAASKELEAALAAANAEKEELSGKIAESAKQVEEMKTRTEKAEARAAELEAEREKITSARDQAVKEAEDAKAEVQTLSSRVTELETERTQLVAARDEARKEAAEAKTALEKSADLIEANRQLEEKLAEAAKQIDGMANDAKEKEKVITDLQANLDTVRKELEDTQNKLKDDRRRFDQLQLANDQLLKEYDEVTGALAAVKLGEVTAAEAKLIQQENEVLRSIIMRQIKEQARREQAYRLAQEEMERLEIKSDTLNDKIIQLAKPTLELSAAEQEMLKRPVVTVLHESKDRISAQIEMLKPSGEGSGEAPVAATDVAASQTAESDAAAPANQSEPATESAPAASADASPTPAPAGSTETAAADSLASKQPPPEVMALIEEARDQFVRGNFASAEDLYQKFVDLQPNSVVALANLGVSQFRQGKLTAAQLALEKALAADPNDAFSLATLGAVMIEQNRIQDAVTYLERANVAAPDDPITLNYLGVASSQLGQFGKAEQSLRRAITVKPEYAEAHFNLAVIYATAKPPSIALAKRHYEKALELGSTPDKRLAAMLQSAPGS